MMIELDWHSFHFEWPLALLLLLALPPVWWVLYRNHLYHMWQQAFLFSQTSTMRLLKLRPSKWNSLRYPLAITVIMSLMVFSIARPVLKAQVPVEVLDMMLVMDISLSMKARDLEPTRLETARKAAIRFIKSLPIDARIGLTLFAGNAYVVSPPTREHQEVIAYLKALNMGDLQPRTEIGGALQATLKAMRVKSVAHHPARTQANSSLLNSNSRVNGLIILLSDGDSREGYPWELAAQEARKRHVPVYTIGVGRDTETSIFYQGLELPVLFSENTLREIARLTQGQYFRVSSTGAFERVYNHIRSRAVKMETRFIDIGFVTTGIALILLMLFSWRVRAH